MAANPAETWQVKTLPEAQGDLDELPDPVRAEALAAIEDLAADPFPADCIPMRGYPHRYRIKFYGNHYRIIYDVSENQKTVKILRARHRRDVYRGQ